jgi:hypothetical protein
MNKYKKLPDYLEVGTKVLEPLDCNQELAVLQDQIDILKRQKKTYRCVMVQSNADIEAKRNPMIWLFAEASGVTARDLKLLGLSNMLEYVDQIAIEVEEQKADVKKATKKILALSREQMCIMGQHINANECMLSSNVVQVLNQLLFKILCHKS